MPRGDKSSYTDKQKRQAEHIEEGYEKRGVPKKEAERRAWATENKMSGGGRKGKKPAIKGTNAPAVKGGKIGGMGVRKRRPKNRRRSRQRNSDPSLWFAVHKPRPSAQLALPVRRVERIADAVEIDRRVGGGGVLAIEDDPIAARLLQIDRAFRLHSRSVEREQQLRSPQRIGRDVERAAWRLRGDVRHRFGGMSSPILQEADVVKSISDCE